MKTEIIFQNVIEINEAGTIPMCHFMLKYMFSNAEKYYSNKHKWENI